MCPSRSSNASSYACIFATTSTAFSREAGTVTATDLFAFGAGVSSAAVFFADTLIFVFDFVVAREEVTSGEWGRVAGVAERRPRFRFGTSTGNTESLSDSF